MGVVIEAMHLCMIMRGVEKQNSVAVTSCMLGGFREQQQTREEFLLPHPQAARQTAWASASRRGPRRRRGALGARIRRWTSFFMFVGPVVSGLTAIPPIAHVVFDAVDVLVADARRATDRALAVSPG